MCVCVSVSSSAREATLRTAEKIEQKKERKAVQREEWKEQIVEERERERERDGRRKKEGSLSLSLSDFAQELPPFVGRQHKHTHKGCVYMCTSLCVDVKLLYALVLFHTHISTHIYLVCVEYFFS